MKIKLDPNVRDNDKIWYEITEDIVIASINGVTDVFDFTNMPDGELTIYDEMGEPVIETILKENPIKSARRKDGELFVEILFSINEYEQDKRLLFPEWITLKEFNNLMEEISRRPKSLFHSE